MSFDEQQTIAAEDIRAEAENFFNRTDKLEHAKVLQEILENLPPVDFREMVKLKEGEKVSQKIQKVLTIKVVSQTARELNCGLCRNQDFVFVYNGEFWQLMDRNEIESFLGKAAARLGVDPITAWDCDFKAKLLKQFLTDAYLPTPESDGDTVLINLQNGTMEINKEVFSVRSFNRTDFLTYQLPFEYQETAVCPKWNQFLDKVLPDKSSQNVLAEYFGSVFARHLKLEKTLILYGMGANGKSVVFDVINAILGKENISNISLESLCQDYYRAMIANKLLNYSSEISNRLQSEKFKQLTSGEPIEARLPYGQPMTLRNYARLAFNCNELPRDVEHTEAFFRRFLILPFLVTIPEGERDPNLAKKIIETELSGVFNWILEGLKRLLDQNGFSSCAAARDAVEQYRRESDSVAMFIDEDGYQKSSGDFISLKDLYLIYKNYCMDNGYRPVHSRNLVKRLEALGFETNKKASGKVIYLNSTGKSFI